MITIQLLFQLQEKICTVSLHPVSKALMHTNCKIKLCGELINHILSFSDACSFLFPIFKFCSVEQSPKCLLVAF